jgi:hypothetical protein
VLKSGEPTSRQIQAAEEARSKFGMWHGISMLVNVATLALVAVAMGMAARLPDTRSQAAGEGPR